MLKIGFAGVVVVAMSLAGCRASQEPAPGAPPAAAETVEQIRAAFQKADPTVRVGRVASVRSQDRLAAVTDMATEGLRQGSRMTFIDSERNTIAYGRVVRIVNDIVVVQYDAAEADGREPREGDVAVKVLPG